MSLGSDVDAPMRPGFVNLDNRARSRPVAQLAERRSPKPQVGGSIPSWPAISLVGLRLPGRDDERAVID